MTYYQKLQEMYEYYVNLIKKFKNIVPVRPGDENIPQVRPSDEICIKLAKQWVFDISRKFRRFVFSLYNYNFNTDDAIDRGLILLKKDTRFRNKPIVAEIKKKNNKLKARNRQLQKVSREYFRRTNPDLEYDINRWDKVPRRIYDDTANQYSQEIMNNPIIKWVLEK